MKQVCEAPRGLQKLSGEGGRLTFQSVAVVWVYLGVHRKGSILMGAELICSGWVPAWLH